MALSIFLIGEQHFEERGRLDTHLTPPPPPPPFPPPPRVISLSTLIGVWVLQTSPEHSSPPTVETFRTCSEPGRKRKRQCQDHRPAQKRPRGSSVGRATVESCRATSQPHRKRKWSPEAEAPGLEDGPGSKRSRASVASQAAEDKVEPWARSRRRILSHPRRTTRSNTGCCTIAGPRTIANQLRK